MNSQALRTKPLKEAVDAWLVLLEPGSGRGRQRPQRGWLTGVTEPPASGALWVARTSNNLATALPGLTHQDNHKPTACIDYKLYAKNSITIVKCHNYKATNRQIAMTFSNSIKLHKCIRHRPKNKISGKLPYVRQARRPKEIEMVKIGKNSRRSFQKYGTDNYSNRKIKQCNLFLETNKRITIIDTRVDPYY